MGLSWLSILFGLLVGAFLGPWAMVKLTGRTGSSTGGY